MTDRTPTPWGSGADNYLAGGMWYFFPQVVANTTAGNGGETDKKGCDGLLVGMELVMPFFLLKDFLQA